MDKILILTDYKGFFGSKQKSNIYNGGFDLIRFKQLFEREGKSVVIKRFTEIDFRQDDFSDTAVLYTSSEDRNLYYKDFVEDILLGIELKGGSLIPAFKYFRAHHNKVFMEILRDISDLSNIKSIHSKYFGCYEDFLYHQKSLNIPLVYKSASGSKSRGVGLSKNKNSLERSAKNISKSINIRDYLWEIGRKLRYKNYKANSSHRKKFLTQSFIPNLQGDWKVLIFYDKYFVLKRYNRKNDFRASGMGNLEYTCSLPDGLLNYANQIYNSLAVPNLSLDIANIGSKFYLLEFQTIYFGTYTLEYSDFYFKNIGDEYIKVNKKVVLEQVFVDSVVKFL